MHYSKIEIFSDGVFAVAMTLLIYQVQLPSLTDDKTNTQLLHDLRGLWTYYIALFSSFFTLLIMWVNHHHILKKIDKVNRTFFFANGVLLFLVVIVPFPTALVSQFLLQPSANVACAAYSGLFILINIAYNLVWFTAMRGRLIAPHIPAKTIKKTAISLLVGFPAYVLAFGVSFFNPILSIIICIAMWVYWASVMKLE